MNTRALQVLFPIILTLTLFSLWAGFALLVVNQLFYQDLPGYTIGRICIWEYVALLVTALLAGWMIKTWGNIAIKAVEGKKVLTMNPKYGTYFTIYFFLALIIGIWQFWVFSQQF